VQAWGKSKKHGVSVSNKTVVLNLKAEWAQGMTKFRAYLENPSNSCQNVKMDVKSMMMTLTPSQYIHANYWTIVE